ncbi:hypothetical protein [Salmonella enterica]|uniref:Uncharacterized protein n=3 Tax=Salmonella enterica TaxID=28901 RepID=A0A7Z1PPD0_SALET|nr:hypothetical protein [Salmonella enterica]ECE0473268.1 hypothetical protein [Salmonella enterica subsp. enterica serovar Glostrup]EEE2766877.1 hypothetical protein [Salmonella enterica subsp. diarizonae]EEJ6656560.1 hypothetical protein [Salmonella enterica subsp. enterica serovar Redlands]EAA8666942.1 hypothetical protein [Salmonella enterica]EAA9928405.1 hypothetical protein [Salmonella enterica]
MENNTLPTQYVSRLLSKGEDDRLDELKDILSELDIGIRLRKITPLQKHEIINEIKRAVASEREISFDEKDSPSDNIHRGNASASNDDLVDLIAMLNRGRSQ